MPEPVSPSRIPTGIGGLDRILDGGLPSRGLYLLEGAPGSGKTTLALQFLLTGVRNREPAFLVSMSETQGEIVEFAASHGWSLDGIEIMDLADLRRIMGEGVQSVFHSSEVEFAEATTLIRKRIEALRPRRVVIDGLSELRHLADQESVYRLHMDALKPQLIDDDRTVLLIDSRSAQDGFALHTLVHGVIGLDYEAPEFGPYRRRLRVQKLRGVKFKEGLHDFEIQTGRVAVYPRIVPAAHVDRPSCGQLPSGIRELDAILGGGLDRGASTLIMGPAGSGKSTLATQYAVATAERGEKAAMYIFDERLNTIVERSLGLGLDLRALMAGGGLTVRPIDPMELTPGKFAHLVQESVAQGATTVVIDSLTGYAASMGDEAHLSLQIRNLLSFLSEKGVTTILVSVQHGLMGDVATQAGYISYIADTVVLLRYYELRGDVRRALSVFKRRAGAHERTIRDINFSSGGIKIGKPLTEFQGVLTGVPTFVPEPGNR